MSSSSYLGGISGVVISPLTTSANKLLHQAPAPGAENAKIEKSAKDFESILLGSWLQQAEQSFASLPGGDGDDDADSGGFAYRLRGHRHRQDDCQEPSQGRGRAG
jgi:hypothetical protein